MDERVASCFPLLNIASTNVIHPYYVPRWRRVFASNFWIFYPRTVGPLGASILKVLAIEARLAEKDLETSYSICSVE